MNTPKLGAKAACGGECKDLWPLKMPDAPSGEKQSLMQKPSERPQTISSAKLFGEAQEIEIDHDGTLYRLRITRQGKLILNK